MKTLVMHCDSSKPIPTFFILSGDFTHLDNVFINSTDSPKELQDVLSNLLYNSETGEYIYPVLTIDDVLDEAVEYSKEYIYSITTGIYV